MDSRRIEKLLALFRYELAPESGGIGSSELIAGLLEHVHAVMLDPPGKGKGGDLTAKQLERIDADIRVLAKHLLLALAESGHIDDAEVFVEGQAAQRRQCAAKFKMHLEAPMLYEEQERLAKEWDEQKRAADAAAEVH